MGDLPKLFHYSSAPVQLPLESRDQRENKRGVVSDKPWGLWVSCCEDADADGETMGWWDWCQSEEWGLESLIFRHSVRLRPDARILHLTEAALLDDFTRRYFSDVNYRNSRYSRYADPKFHRNIIDWKAISEAYQGIVISPYQWSQRLELAWYYGWDCASGCIWDADAVASIECDMPQELIERLDS